MKKLTKAQVKQRDDLTTKLEAAEEALRTSIEAFNEHCSERFEADVQPAVDALNDLMREAQEFREEVWGEMDAYAAERSERWSEGEAGTAYSAWMSEWGVSFDEIEVERPADCDVPDMPGSSTLAALPEEPA